MPFCEQNTDLVKFFAKLGYGGKIGQLSARLWLNMTVRRLYEYANWGTLYKIIESRLRENVVACPMHSLPGKESVIPAFFWRYFIVLSLEMQIY